jgi:hypothetical protein
MIKVGKYVVNLKRSESGYICVDREDNSVCTNDYYEATQPCNDKGWRIRCRPKMQIRAMLSTSLSLKSGVESDIFPICGLCYISNERFLFLRLHL